MPLVARKALVLIVYLTVPGVQPALAQSSPQPETVNIPVADVSIESGDTSNTESPQANGYINALFKSFQTSVLYCLRTFRSMIA